MKRKLKRKNIRKYSYELSTYGVINIECEPKKIKGLLSYSIETPATFDMVGYSALTFTEIGLVTNYGR